MRNATLVLLVAVGCSSSRPVQPASDNLVIHGPFVHENLAIYVVEDRDRRDTQEFITLEEGLASGTVTVSEKENAQVRELWIENRSDKPLFVQAGDVVKGGQQDRAISADFVVPARSGKTGIPSFCVERGRWSGEQTFALAENSASSNETKLAIMDSKDQGAVWNSVRLHKEKMAKNNNLSPSTTDSLNEESQHKDILEILKKFEAALGGVLGDRSHACGLVVVVNGSIRGADLYASPGLFRKLFPRILKTAAMEAIANPAKESKTAPDAVTMRDYLAQSREGKKQEEKVREDLRAIRTENEKTVTFSCAWNETLLRVQAIEK